MPPKGSGSRRTRSSMPSDEFQKPKLPPLAGTPSSRRQYAYGAEAEPPPSRPTRGVKRGSLIDLGGAVQNALDRQSRAQKLAHLRVVEQRKTQMIQEQEQLRETDPDTPNKANDQDELAMDERTFQQTSAGGNPYIHGSRQSAVSRLLRSDASEFDDVRSFGVESEFYGDATIASTPASILPSRIPEELPQLTEPEPSLRPQRGNFVPTLSQKTQPLNRSSNFELYSGPGDDSDSGHSKEEGEIPSVTHLGTRPSLTPSRTPAAASPGRRSTRLTARRTLQHTDNAADNGELELHSRRHESDTLPDRSQAPGDFDEKRALFQKQRPRTTQSRTVAASLESSTRPQAVKETQKDASIASPSIWDRFTPDRLRRRQIQGGSIAHAGADPFQTLADTRRAIVDKAKSFATSSSPFRRHSLEYSSVESQQDDEMQAELRREALQAEKAIAQEESQRRTAARRQALYDRWQRLKINVADCLNWTMHQSTGRGDDYLYETGSSWDWFTWLNPVPLLGDVFTSLGSFAIAVYDALAAIQLHLSSWLKSHYKSMLWLVLLLSAFSVLLRPEMQSYMSEISSRPVSSPMSWERLEDAKQYLVDLVPQLSLRPRGFSLDDFQQIDGDGQARIEYLLRGIEEELGLSKKANQRHDAALKQLKSMIPPEVFMTYDNGNLKITPNIWQAIRDRIFNDEDIATFEKQANHYGMSDKQWRAVTSQLEADPIFTSKLNSTLGQMESRLQNNLRGSWDAWVRENAELVNGRPDWGSQDDASSRMVDDAVRGHLQQQEADGRIVTRDEFLRHIRNELATHRREIQAEFNDLRPQISKTVGEAMQLELQNQPKGLSRSETETLVASLVRKTVGDLHLQSTSGGAAQVSWDVDLKNRINYLTTVAGAKVDSKYTSPTYNPLNKPLIKDESWARAQKDPTLRSELGPFPPAKALLGWHEDGDCWCASRSVSRRGNPHGAMLSVLLGYNIIPTSLVIEHILPGATVDPTSRPRQLEVYVRIEDPKIRAYVKDFSEAEFPDDRNQWDYTPMEDKLGSSYVKVGEFEYETEGQLDGRYRYDFSKELMGLKAFTEAVVVRAVSNYGADKYTCFYRVLLYGKTAKDIREENGT